MKKQEKEWAEWEGKEGGKDERNGMIRVEVEAEPPNAAKWAKHVLHRGREGPPPLPSPPSFFPSPPSACGGKNFACSPCCRDAAVRFSHIPRDTFIANTAQYRSWAFPSSPTR